MRERNAEFLRSQRGKKIFFYFFNESLKIKKIPLRMREIGEEKWRGEDSRAYACVYD